MSLNKAQKEAVSHKEGPCLVLAGPGSGKTLTIAKRIEYLIKVSWKDEDFLSHLEHFMAFFTEF